jgi:hypothetical protein
MRQARHEDAEPFFLEACQGRRGKLGQNHPDTLELRNQLSQLYESWGKPEEAQKWRATQ